MKSKRVLTFRPGSIGDCLMAKYLLENIRAKTPEGRFTIAVPTRLSMIKNLFAAYPWLEVVETGSLRLPRRDIVVTPYTGGVFPLKTKLFARLLAKKLIGFSDRSSLNRFIYNKVIPLVGRSRAPRLLECDSLNALGIPVTIERPSFVYLPQPSLLPRLGLQERKYVVLHLFSGSDTRGLSPERKRLLLRAMARLPLKLVCTGTMKEIASLGVLPEGTVTAETTLQELAHLIDHAALMVSLDTGAAHMAAHMRKPLIVLASCVGMQWWGSGDMYGDGVPAELFVRPDICKDGHDRSGYALCLDAIDTDAVAKRAAEL